MKRKILLFILVLSSILTFGQEQKSIENSYVDYFSLPRETLFLHTNKTTFIVGEEAWFKVYAYDRKNHLSSKATKNIHLTLYNNQGVPIDHKLLQTNNGFTHGNIAIDSTFTSGDYFLKVSTNWMRNFTEDDSYIQKIQVINPKDEKREILQTFSKEYDFQLLPEGGYILSDIKNSIGIKMIDDKGLGTACEGVIINSKGEEITSFKTNNFGLGKFSLTPFTNESYTAKVVLPNGKEFEQKLLNIQNKGVNIQVNNLKKDEVIIDLSTNETSWKLVQNESFKMLIHKDGVAKIIPISFNNTKERIIIGKSGLFKGINTITLFNQQNQPILERMFFNDFKISYKTITIHKKEKIGDSITYLLNTKLTDSTFVNTSISVLPTQTKGYEPSHNIISSFYLKPYLKGTIEKPQYYFRKRDRKRTYELDVLLLTQGWSRYDWNKIFKSPPHTNYTFEDGFVLKGNINNDLSKVKSLLLYPSKFNKSRFIQFDESGRFNIPNFYPSPNEKLRFSYINKRGKVRRSYMAANIVIPSIDKKLLDVRSFKNYNTFYADKNSIPNNFFNDQTEVLDEIVLESRLNNVFKKRGPAFKGSIIKVNDSVAKNNITLERIFKKENFKIFYDDTDYSDGFQIRIVSREGTADKPGRPIIFFIDGQRIRPERIHNLLTTNTTTFEDIYIDYSHNVVQGDRGPIRGAILVNTFTRISDFEDLDLMKTQNNIVKISQGFESAKKFYTPRYIDYNIKPFKDHGVIHWEPNVSIQNNNSFEMTIVNTGLDEVNIYIEGITSKGDLISQKITLNN